MKYGKEKRKKRNRIKKYEELPKELTDFIAHKKKQSKWMNEWIKRNQFYE